MLQDKIFKLKKYLFFISILFFIVTISHLIYIYIYHDSKLDAIEGGTISEALIWGTPSLNPLKSSQWNNKYIISLLYRSLMQYDIENQKIVWDIASCDVSNLANIDCILEPNIFWSNGEAITTQDVFKTYTLLQNSELNPVIGSLLWTTNISVNKNTITFKNTRH